MIEQHSIDNMDDIPALVGTFATNLGWTSGPATNGVTLQAPGDVIEWTLRYSLDALECVYLDENSNSAFWEYIGLTQNSALLNSPIHYTGDLGDEDPAMDPIGLWIIGANDPAPYIHIVVVYGTNLFRHMYIGFTEKIGTYGGGNVISATKGPSISSSDNLAYNSFSDMKYLFQGTNNAVLSNDSGGVLIDHVDNAQPWRSFYGVFTNSPFDDATTAYAVIGGFGDSINDGYLARGTSPFAGENILTPINLYMPQPITGDCTFVPLGRVAGIRLVHMQNLDPATEIVVGGIRWMVFPSHGRRSEKNMPIAHDEGSEQHARAFESSYWVGYAISIGEEDSNS